jgi:hypothetical protein
MKINYLIILFSAILLYSCEKSNPEIAGTDELSSISYQEKIYAQPIIIGDQIISVQNKENTNLLTAFNNTGAVEWSTDIDDYIISGTNYNNVPYLSLSKNKNNELFLNFFSENNNGTEIIKVVRFSTSGEFISQFTDSIHQNIPNFVSATKRFAGLGVLPLDDGNVAVVSSLTVVANQQTFIQMSEYNSDGEHFNDTTYTIDQLINPYQVFLASNNRLVFQTGNEFGISRFVVFNPESSEIFTSPEFPVFDLLSFYENSKGDFIITASAFVDNLDYYGIIISISSNAEYLWHQIYTEQTAWLLTSVTEVSNGYIFTGFDITGQLLNEFDWRSSLDNEKVFGIIMKTDFNGKINQNTGWSHRIMSSASTACAAVLQNETGGYTVLGGKYDRDIHSTMVLKINETGEIIN